MKNDIDAELAALVPVYLEARRRDLDTLRARLAQRRWEEIRRIGHKMAGTGTTYGLGDVSHLGGALEVAAQAADASAIGALLDELQTTLANT